MEQTKPRGNGFPEGRKPRVALRPSLTRAAERKLLGPIGVIVLGCKGRRPYLLFGKNGHGGVFR